MPVIRWFVFVPIRRKAVWWFSLHQEKHYAWIDESTNRHKNYPYTQTVCSLSLLLIRWSYKSNFALNTHELTCHVFIALCLLSLLVLQTATQVENEDFPESTATTQTVEIVIVMTADDKTSSAMDQQVNWPPVSTFICRPLLYLLLTLLISISISNHLQMLMKDWSKRRILSSLIVNITI